MEPPERQSLRRPSGPGWTSKRPIVEVAFYAVNRSRRELSVVGQHAAKSRPEQQVSSRSTHSREQASRASWPGNMSVGSAYQCSVKPRMWVAAGASHEFLALTKHKDEHRRDDPRANV